MTINIADNSPRANYTATSGQTVFTVSFEFFDEADLTVYINGTETSAYTVTGGDGSTGTVTLTSGATAGDKIAIVRDVAIERTTDFTEGAAISRSALNEQLDKLTAQVADINDRASRSLQLNDHEVAASTSLPATDDRKGKVLGFNEVTGDVQSGPSLTDVQSLADVSADIATLADIEDGTDATDAIQTAASISSDITTVSGISSNVTTVAGISSDVTAVAADATDIGTVATNISSVNTVATNIADVITVANDLNEAVSEVVTVADDLNEAVSEIDTVAGSISNVDTVGTNIADVNTVAGISANVTTVAGISANTTTVAGISANVTTVAGISSDVTAVAADATDIGTVATSISNVNAVAGNATNINAVAGNATNINTVASDSVNIGTVAGISANVSTVAGLSSSVSTLALISSDITTVAGISANVTTVAGDTANIATIATNLNGTNTIGTVAGSISNVNSVGGAIADVSTVASNLTDVQAFANTYRIGATDPTTSLDEGDLFYNTTSNTLKVYSGSAWEQGVTAGSGFLPLTGGGLTGNLTFGDNDKAIFGAGSDLQIYSNGTNSFISESNATGSLFINASNLVLRNTSGEYYFYGNSDGAVNLYYDNASKLATTSTGIDVTGTVTADGLTVDGNATIGQTSGSDRTLSVGSAGAMHFDIDTVASTGRVYLNATNDSTSGRLILQTADTDRVLVNNNGDISFYEDTGTTPKFFWDASAESLGIGTTTPAAELHIVESGGTPEIRLADGTNAAMFKMDTVAHIGSVTNVGLAFDINSTEKMRLTSAGLGIGTSSPSSLLHINGNTPVFTIRDTRSKTWVSGETLGTINFASADASNTPTNIAQINVETDDGSVGTYTAMTFSTATPSALSERMRIDSSGNVGIGTSSPIYAADIRTSGTNNGQLRVGGGLTSATGLLFEQTNSGTTTANIQNSYYSTSASASLSIKSGYTTFHTGTSGAERMRIDSSGNVLVGKTTSAFGTQGIELQSDGELIATKNGTPIYVNRITTDGAMQNFYKDGSLVGSIGNAGTNFIVEATSSSRTGLNFGGVITPRYNGSDSSSTVDFGSSSLKFKDGHFSGTVNAANFNTTSDATLKTNVETLTGSLDAVKALRGVSFDWIENGNSEVGVIAQEVEAVVPDVVSTDDQGIKSVKYGNLVGVLIEAIKEQQKRIEALEAKLGD